MRFIVIPIHRSFYALHCHVPPTSPFLSALKSASASSSSPTSKPSLFQTLPTRVIQEGTKKWDEWGACEPHTWRYRTYAFGNKVLDRLEAEEWFLKEIPVMPREAAAQLEGKDENGKSIFDGTRIPVTLPSRVDPTQVHAFLTTLASERMPYHKKWMYLSTGVIPFSAAFTVVPGPNLPLFYNCFRIWSHFRAVEGAKTLQYLAEKNALVYDSEAELDRILEGEDWEERVLSQEAVAAIAKLEGSTWAKEEGGDGRFGGMHLERDLTRARNQVLRMLEKQGGVGSSSVGEN
ncbi:hypothetical protein HK102_013811 [Quaeritorhiza haematococci]|nr:hypothetical protein HK102_013811 [Quaeritorhiza haematococci]